jgi:hypothetical protein
MKTETRISEYEQQAIDFCDKNKAKISWTYRGHSDCWGDGKDHAVWCADVENSEGRTENFKFHQSLIDSYYIVDDSRSFGRKMPVPQGAQVEKWVSGGRVNYRMNTKSPATNKCWTSAKLHPNVKEPSVYDLLACLTKYDPGTLDDFCGEFGYDPDSKKATETYFAVQQEWQKISRLFSDCIEELAEIS